MDHLQDKKWSFRVKTKKGDAFMGMKRFSLQHPGTRNYVHEWIYHRMMEEEGIMSLRYFFLNVRVNNEDWGIYALEEHFTEEMVENNARMKGPVVRYNRNRFLKIHRCVKFSSPAMTALKDFVVVIYLLRKFLMYPKWQSFMPSSIWLADIILWIGAM
jgi:hypothetical protein